MTTTSPISDDMDMTKWSPEQRLSFYEDIFFGWRLGLSSFDELPLAQRRHIVARCLEDMATLGWPDRSLGLIADMTKEPRLVVTPENGNVVRLS